MAYNNDRRDNRRNRSDEPQEFSEKVVALNRVSKTVKGGRVAKFSALVVVGDGKGRVGCGIGKATEIPEAARKATEDAKKHLVHVSMKGTSIPHETVGRFGTGEIVLLPAPEGTGVIAGGAVRAVMECAGITDVLTKSMGSATAVNVVRATVDALKKLEEPEEIAARRGMSLEEVAPDALLRARAEGIAEARKAREEAQAKAAQKDGE